MSLPNLRESEYIDFTSGNPSKSGKTWVWQVFARRQTDGEVFVLGTVKWASRWRRYAFYPEENTVYEWNCMRDIATFIRARTIDHKERSAQNRAIKATRLAMSDMT